MGAEKVDNPLLIVEKKATFTKALVKGPVYGEKTFTRKDGQWREWVPKRSKLCAAIRKGMRQFPFDNDSTVLYLGAASGTTVSHVSDLCPEGMIFAVEFSPDTGRQLMLLAKKRGNIAPIIADANQPITYAPRVWPAEILYQDVAQRNQVDILKRNAQMLLKQGGTAFLCCKARSIDVARNPADIFAQVRGELKGMFQILEELDLRPFTMDHRFYVMRKL
ncbi:hypothetical protein AUJ68_03590 [Candidatus Woesearchaeota archaeon CG1_02_57_44]|nr:MAG: hypothetical protein AUJ68_03590 [Candidatus Woesearchaeota archaeon CG1_02_57_44]